MGEKQTLRDLGLQDCSTSDQVAIFDPKNPTGHYSLELGEAFDAERFERLRVSSEWAGRRFNARERVLSAGGAWGGGECAARLRQTWLLYLAR